MVFIPCLVKSVADYMCPSAVLVFTGVFAAGRAASVGGWSDFDCLNCHPCVFQCKLGCTSQSVLTGGPKASAGWGCCGFAVTLRQDVLILDGLSRSVCKWSISIQLVMFEEIPPFPHLLRFHAISLTDVMTAR